MEKGNFLTIKHSFNTNLENLGFNKDKFTQYCLFEIFLN
jgi:hypothetical protein